MVMPAQPHVETLMCTHAHAYTLTHTRPHFPPVLFFDADARNMEPQSSFEKGENYLSEARLKDSQTFLSPTSKIF